MVTSLRYETSAGTSASTTRMLYDGDDLSAEYDTELPYRTIDAPAYGSYASFGGCLSATGAGVTEVV